VTEHFFEIGGNPWLAIELFGEIERVFGRTFSPLVIYQAPTIASQTILLEGPASVPFPKCVLLRAGGVEPPIFIAHGLGGNIMELCGFANGLDCDRSIYGLQERGTDGLEEPLSSIEEMACSHAKAIREIEPRGPYILIGYSFGGLVTLEIARHLDQTGGKIALLVMIDAYPHIRYSSLLQRAQAFSIRLGNYALKKLRPSVRPPTLGIDFTPAMTGVRRASMEALRNYHIRYYHGCIRFIRAKTHLFFPNQEQIWAKFADRFAVESVAGNHLELVTTYHANLAAVISRYLRDLYVAEDHRANEWSVQSR